MDSASSSKCKETTSDTPALGIHPVWNLETVYIQVNETLFFVPKSVLLGASTNSPFEVIFAAPPIDKDDIEGTSRENPIRLEQIAEADFDNFLRALYPLPKVPPPTSYEDWLGVLELSHMWHYDAIRRKAIEELTPKISASASRKINLGSRYLVQKWVRQGYVQLICDTKIQPQYLSKKPFELSWEIIAKVFQAKYLCLQATLTDSGRDCTCGVAELTSHGGRHREERLSAFACQCRALKLVNEVLREEVASAKFDSE